MLFVFSLCLTWKELPLLDHLLPDDVLDNVVADASEQRNGGVLVKEPLEQHLGHLGFLQPVIIKHILPEHIQKPTSSFGISSLPPTSRSPEFLIQPSIHTY